MPTIFEGIQPLEKKRRTTRSQTRCLQKIKRVISCVDKDDVFEHFCSISLNNRISNLANNNSIYDPIIMDMSHKFLADHNVRQKSSVISVTFNPKHDSNSLSSMVAKHKRKKSPCTDRSSDNNSPQRNTNTKSYEDVIIVNPVDDSVIIIEDSLTVPSSDSDYIPLVSESQHKSDQSCTLPSYIPLVSESDQNKLTTNVPIINILDEDVEEDKDIIFVKEEILNNKQFNGTKRMRKKKISSLKKAKQNRKKERLKEATLKFLCVNIISELTKKRCVKCINVNTNLARSCPCKKASETDNFKSDSVTSSHPKPISSVNPWNAWNGVLQQTLTNVGAVNVASNVFNPNTISRTGLREIVIDGSNVALGHTNGRSFSVKGLKIAIDYFVKRGHKVVAFVPQYRQKHNQTTDTPLLNLLADKGYVVFTPSREVNGRRITPYDDRYIIQYAAACEGIVVSSDNYRDLFLERTEWRTTIERRLLMPTWVGDMLMFPEDPLGRRGPHLSEFLKFP